MRGTDSIKEATGPSLRQPSWVGKTGHCGHHTPMGLSGVGADPMQPSAIAARLRVTPGGTETAASCLNFDCKFWATTLTCLVILLTLRQKVGYTSLYIISELFENSL